MRNWSAGLLAYYEKLGNKTRVVCCEVLRVDGHADRGTTYSEDLVIDGNTYSHATGGEVSDIETNAAMDTANAEMKLPLSTLSTVTQANIRAGLYAGASMHLFVVDPGNIAAYGKGTLLKHKFGRVTIQRNVAVFELLGVMDAYQQAFGDQCTPSCRYNLGNGATYTIYGRDFVLGEARRCRVDLTPFIVAGTLTGVSADGRTFRDSARTEAGPAGGIAILAISNANPGIVTLDSPPPANGTGMIMSGITTPGSLNGTTIVRDRSGATFALGIDTTNTTNYPAYTGSGIATPIGADAGYFAYGLMIAQSADGLVLAREIKSYVKTGGVGQWTLHQPFPFALVNGDNYTLVPGCNKTPADCEGKYSNYRLHFGGFDKVPLMDSIKQIGKAA